jgi:hypothetical protein
MTSHHDNSIKLSFELNLDAFFFFARQDSSAFIRQESFMSSMTNAIHFHANICIIWDGQLSQYNDQATASTTEESLLNSRQGQEMFLFSKAFRSALGLSSGHYEHSGPCVCVCVCVKLTTNLRLVPKLRMREPICTSTLQHVFIAWCSIKQKDNCIYP